MAPLNEYSISTHGQKMVRHAAHVVHIASNQPRQFFCFKEVWGDQRRLGQQVINQRTPTVFIQERTTRSGTQYRVNNQLRLTAPRAHTLSKSAHNISAD